MKYFLSLYFSLISVFVLAQGGKPLKQTNNNTPIADGHIKRIGNYSGRLV